MMHFRIRSECEVSVRWYTPEQEHYFKHVLNIDATRQSKVYFALKKQNPRGVLPKEELVKFVGFVHLLSEDVRARYRECKQKR